MKKAIVLSTVLMSVLSACGTTSVITPMSPQVKSDFIQSCVSAMEKKGVYTGAAAAVLCESSQRAAEDEGRKPNKMSAAIAEKCKTDKSCIEAESDAYWKKVVPAVSKMM